MVSDSSHQSIYVIIALSLLDKRSLSQGVRHRPGSGLAIIHLDQAARQSSNSCDITMLVISKFSLMFFVSARISPGTLWGQTSCGPAIVHPGVLREDIRTHLPAYII